MDREDLTPRVLMGLLLCAVMPLWTGCSMPQKPQDDAKAKAEAERQKEEERQRLEAEIRAKLEREAAEKEKEREKERQAAEEARKKEEEAKLAAAATAAKKEAEDKAKAEDEAKKKEEEEAGVKAGAGTLTREEYLAKAAAARTKRQEEYAKGVEAKKEKVRTQQLKAWLPGLSKNVRGFYCFADDTAQSPNVLICEEYLKLVGLLPRAWDVSEHERNTMIPRFARDVMMADARNERVTVNPELILSVIADIATPDLLLDLHNNQIPAAIKPTYDEEEAARRQRVISMSRVSLGLSSLQNADAMWLVHAKTDAASKTDATPEVKMRQEFQKALGILPTEVRAYWKALNDLRHARAMREVLKQVQVACRARLVQLGVKEDQLTGVPAEKRAAGPATGPATPATPTVGKGSVIIYKLKDGRQIRAVAVVELGEEVSVKDEAGKVETLRKSDILDTQKILP